MASEKQMNVISNTITRLREVAGANLISQELDNEFEKALAPFAEQIASTFAEGDIEGNPTELVSLCFEIRNRLKSEVKEARWKKLYGEWVVYGPSSMIKIGETVTVVSSKGPQEVEIGEILETYGENVFAKPVEKEKADLEVGLYRSKNGDLIRVYKAKKGHKLCKLVSVEDPKGSYVGTSPLRELKPEDQITDINILSDLGIRSNFCMDCGRELTNHESISRGIGPVCFGKYGL
jgi:hypothetical protein